MRLILHLIYYEFVTVGGPMDKLAQRMILWPTLKGKVKIISGCRPDEIREYHFDRGFGTYAHYKSLYTRRESLEKIAEQTDTNVTLALSDKNIIGFGVLAYPEAGERWAKLEPRLMLEIKALEVSRGWRSGTAGA